MAKKLRPIRTKTDHKKALAEVMNRKRSLSIYMIRRLHEQLGISAEVLIRPTRADEAA